MTTRILGIAALVLALATLVLPFMAVGQITTGAFVGVVQKTELVVFLAPVLLAGLLAGLGGALGFGKGKAIASIVLGVLATAVWALLFIKLKDGATAGLGMHAMGAASLLALTAGVVSLFAKRPATTV